MAEYAENTNPAPAIGHWPAPVSEKTPAQSSWPRLGWALALAGTLLVGAALRLVWVRDMEYKNDEWWMFQRVQNVGRTEPFPWLGQPSSVGVCTPGMSVWAFLWLGRLLDAQDPTTLARSVQVLSIAAIVLLLGFTLRVVPREEREPWLWAAALVSVDPLTVIYHRKMWMPSLFPMLTMLMLMGWWRRDRRWGAFLWGVVGACLGQIQMGGFFFAAGFAAWALLFDRRRVRWLGWLAGSCLGALPLLPWLGHMVTGLHGGPSQACSWHHYLIFHFWSRWFFNPLGLTLQFSLGNDFKDFLSYPVAGGHPTYLVAVLHGLIFLVGMVVLLRASYRLWRDRPPLREVCIGKDSPTAFTVGAALWGYGILLTASSLPVHRHYLIILFPLGFVWLARLALGRAATPKLGRSLLATLGVAQCLVTVAFLYYIHVNQRDIPGDYRMPYGAQARARMTNSE